MNDVDFPVAKVLDGIDAAAEAGLAPVKVEHGRQARRQRRRHRGAGRALPRHRRTSCASSSSWTSAPPTAGGWTTSCRRRRSSTRISADWPLEPVDRTTPARSRSASATPTAAARSASSPRSPSRSAAPARAPASRPRASSTPACSRPAATTCASCCARASTTTELDERIRGIWRAAPTATPSSAPPRRPRAAEGRDVAHRRLSRSYRPTGPFRLRWRAVRARSARTARGRRYRWPGSAPDGRNRTACENGHSVASAQERLAVVFVPGTKTTPSPRRVVYVPGTRTTTPGDVRPTRCGAASRAGRAPCRAGCRAGSRAASRRPGRRRRR